MSYLDNPLTGEPPAEVPLKDAPLERVIAQVRFPTLVTMESGDYIGPFQQAFRTTYPVLSHDQGESFMVGPVSFGVTLAKSGVSRFADVDGAWRISVAPDFIALETEQYQSRGDFLRRWSEVLRVAHEILGLQAATRLGLRYIDRFMGPSLNDIEQLVRREFLGLRASPIASSTRFALSEAMFDVDGASLLARWGVLAPRMTVDPTAVGGLEQESWLLDIDMFREGPRRFVLEDIMNDTERFASRLYTFFRWVVTDEFVRRYQAPREAQA